MKKINKDKIANLWPHLAESARLYLPVKEDDSVNFLPWEAGLEVDLETLNSVVPPKNIFFPQTENYLRFCNKVHASEMKFEEIVPEGANIIFGMRPCDWKGIELLDHVFLQEPVDALYKERREQTTVVALACAKPDPTCFCTAFSIEPGAAPGADVLATDLGDTVVFKPQSKKGEDFIALIDNLLEDAAGEAAAASEQHEAAKEILSRPSISVEGLKEKLDDMFEDPIWDKLYRRCLGCGTCTYLCPTCHCFDIQDHVGKDEGLRFRCWDSCMYGDFTLMAGGHNPRPTQKERVRNRFLHKLNYFAHNFGEYACVGCGRCIRKCPVNLDILQVINALGGVTIGSS